MIKTKEDLLGTKIRYKGKEQWELIKVVCWIKGISHVTWTGCDHYEGNTVALISHKGVSEAAEKVISVGDGSWEEDEKTTPEFQNLREIDFSEFVEFFSSFTKNNKKEDVKPKPQYKYTPVEAESIFDLKDLFENGELYFKSLGDKPEGGFGVVYDQIVDESMLFTRYEEGRLLTREKISWQEQLCEEWADFNTDTESIYYHGALAKEDMILFAKRVLELSGESL